MVPEGWEWAALGELVDLKGGHGFPIEDQGFEEGGIPFIKVSDLNLRHNERFIRFWNNSVSPELAEERGWKPSPAGSIVFPKVGAALLANKRRLLARKTIIDNNMMAATPRAVEGNFLFYVLQTIDFAAYVRRGAVPSVNQSVVASIQIRRPPLKEQVEIATILASVDDAIVATRKVVEQTKGVKKGVLQDLMTRGIEHDRFRKTEIGEIPEEWDVVRLGEISEIRRGASPRPIGNPKWFSEDGAGWVRIGDVTSSDRFLRETEQYLSSSGVEKSVPVERGDVIMSICATIGIPVIVDMDACIHDGFVVFQRLSDSVNREFLRFFIQWKTAWLESLGQHGTQKNLNTGIVKSIPMPLPSRSEQHRIVSTLLKLDERRRKGERTFESYNRLKRGLMQDLLTGRVRVNVD